MFQDRAQAFLALPSGEAASAALADEIGQVLSEQGVDPIRATDVSAAGVLSDQILSAIRRAEVVVADLTGANPNVLFEVGVAMGLNKPLLLIAQAPAAEMPFDLRTQQVAMYRPDDLTAVRRYVELWMRDVRARRQSAAY